MKRDLHAFYDFEVCPISFDFCCFLALAEIERQARNLVGLRIIIVPAAADGFRKDDANYDRHSKEWRLQNIVLPACSMIGDHVAVYLCRNRRQAEEVERSCDGAIFPEGYATKAPVGNFLWSGIAAATARDVPIPSFAASAEARNLVRRWIESHLGRRHPVTITLRESTNFPERNSNLEAWAEFANCLNPDKFGAIIVRDTQQLFDPVSMSLERLPIFDGAALHLDLRLALYEESWLNLFVMNGPAVLCALSKSIRYVMFKLLNDSSPNTTALYYSSIGMTPYRQFPHATPFQRLVWEPDTLDVIEREFAAMAERIDNAPAGTAPAPDPANAEEPMAVALRLQATGRLDEAASIYHDIVSKDPNNADAWHLLGIIAHQAERPEVAEQVILRAISLRPGQANYYINLAAVLRKAKRRDEAIKYLWRAIDLAPQDAGAHADLAELLHAQGAGEEAKSALLESIRLKPDSHELCERAARVWHELGYAADAARLYRRAVDLREARHRQARLARAHMSEIPVATLKTT